MGRTLGIVALAAVVSAPALLSACARSVVWTPRPDVPERVAVDATPADIQVFWAASWARRSMKEVTNPGVLPAGCGFGRGELGVFECEPDFPTAEQPHLVLGELRSETGPIGRELEELREEAARRGGNALVMSERSGWVVRLGDETAREEPSAKTLLLRDDARPKNRAQFTPLGEPIGRQMDDVQPFSVPVKRGQCLSVAFALDADARWAADLLHDRSSRTSVELRLVEGEAALWATPRRIYEWWSPGPRWRQRSGWTDLGCAAEDTTWTIAAARTFRTPQPRRLGEGTIVFQLHSVQLDEQTFAKLERQRAAGRERSKAKAAADQAGYVRAACRTCMPHSPGCYVEAPNRPIGCDAALRCLRQQDLVRPSLDQCLRVLREP